MLCDFFFKQNLSNIFFKKNKQCIPLSYSRSTLYWKLVTIQSNWELLKVNCIISMTKWCNISGIKYKLANFQSSRVTSLFLSDCIIWRSVGKREALYLLSLLWFTAFLLMFKMKLPYRVVITILICIGMSFHMVMFTSRYDKIFTNDIHCLINKMLLFSIYVV